ncbi:endonuclease/exonuclease/phosphatase family protein [Vogesella sp. GCM10023246]|uniref:Endonuclease/exonuclease/phosphatase family protein n=1 Tax=Vogesella oryzagri TaxID=3160864 RepID=A0ABV1M2U8_9NEIS
MENNLYDKKIGIAWWNTALSPSAAPDRSDEASMQNAALTIEQLLTSNNTGILGLCEISDSDINKLETIFSQKKELSPYKIIRATKHNTHNFNLCICYNEDHFLPYKEEGKYTQFISSMVLSSNVKIGVVVKFMEKLTSHIFSVIVSHWPSRITNGEMHPTREKYGGALLSVVDAMREKNKNENIILMGDYNDDPFASSIFHSLQATSDIDLAKLRPLTYLYNPFWSKLGEYTTHPMKGGKHYSASGSYFYRGGQYTNWHVFDQIMISGSIFHATTISYVENSAEILKPHTLTSKIKSTKEIFDHFPVKIDLLFRKIKYEQQITL